MWRALGAPNGHGSETHRGICENSGVLSSTETLLQYLLSSFLRFMFPLILESRFGEWLIAASQLLHVLRRLILMLQGVQR